MLFGGGGVFLLRLAERYLEFEIPHSNIPEGPPRWNLESQRLCSSQDTKAPRCTGTPPQGDLVHLGILINRFDCYLARTEIPEFTHHGSGINVSNHNVTGSPGVGATQRPKGPTDHPFPGRKTAIPWSLARDDTDYSAALVGSLDGKEIGKVNRAMANDTITETTAAQLITL